MRWGALFLLAGGALFLSSCAGYRLGPTNERAAGAVSVQVLPFQNQTLEPRLSDAVNAALRKELQRDGTYRLATRNDGDLLVSGVITRYQRRELSLVPDDLTTARDYAITLAVQLTARERGSGRVLVAETVHGNTMIRVGNDLTSTERQALPLLASDFARHAVALLADGTWER